MDAHLATKNRDGGGRIGAFHGRDALIVLTVMALPFLFLVFAYVRAFNFPVGAGSKTRSAWPRPDLAR